jgi:hypothetical protein
VLPNRVARSRLVEVGCVVECLFDVDVAKALDDGRDTPFHSVGGGARNGPKGGLDLNRLGCAHGVDCGEQRRPDIRPNGAHVVVVRKNVVGEALDQPVALVVVLRCRNFFEGVAIEQLAALPQPIEIVDDLGKFVAGGNEVTPHDGVEAGLHLLHRLFTEAVDPASCRPCRVPSRPTHDSGSSGSAARTRGPATLHTQAGRAVVLKADDQVDGYERRLLGRQRMMALRPRPIDLEILLNNARLLERPGVSVRVENRATAREILHGLRQIGRVDDAAIDEFLPQRGRGF